MTLIIDIIKYQLYLLQLENYELGRYWVLLWKRGIWPSKKRPLRKELVWTAKAKALMLMAAALHLLIVIIAGLVIMAWRPGLDNFFTAIIICALVFLPFYFILFSIALLILMPADALVKNRIIRKANLKIERFKDLKIIGVAGSYGKTTMKQVLLDVLSIKFKTIATPESVNTPVGIVRWILKNVDEGTQVAIIEMGEHYSGDIKQLCEIAKPDIAVITGINEAHLERMGSLENVVATIFEIADEANPGGTMVLNADDQNVMGNYQKFVWPDHKIERFKVEDLRLRNFDAEKLVWHCEIDGVGKVEINLLGEYALGDVSAAVKIGRSLDMGNEDIKRGIANIKPVEHRLQPIKSAANVLVIDDSYNGNPDGAREAVKLLSLFTNRRKLYITPGLVEMGKPTAEIHREIGRQLASAADVVILIKNSVTPFIAEAIDDDLTVVVGKTDRVKPKIIWFDTAQEAHQNLKNILKPGDVILFQNDWGDQYI